MRKSREPNGMATSALTGLLVFAILRCWGAWHPSSGHIDYWLAGLIGGASSLAARWLVKIATGTRT